MNSLVDMFERAATAWSHWMLPMSWQVALMALVILGIAWAARKAPPRFRYMLWCLVLVKLCLPPTFALVTGIGQWLPASQPEEIVVVEPAANTVSHVAPTPTSEGWAPAAILPESLPALGEPRATSVAEPVVASPVPSYRPSLRAILMGLWAAGVALMALLITAQHVRLARMLSRGRPVEDPEILDMLHEAAQSLGVRRNVTLLSVPELESPILFGLFRPRIAVPGSALAALPPEQLRPVLLHELSHLKRRDLWVNGLQMLLQLLYWFHPMVWIVNARLRAERELIVDDMVLHALKGERRSYSDSLLTIIRQSAKSHFLTPGYVGIMEPRASLSHRLRRILDENRKLTLRLGIASVLLVALLGLILIPQARSEKAPEVAGTTVEETPPAARSSSTATSTSEEAAPQQKASPAAVDENAMRVAGTVRDQEGRPVANAAVQQLFTWPSAEVLEGPARVAADAPEGFAVEGEVRDTEGKPVAGAHVSYSVRRTYAHYRDTRTDEEGRFKLSGIAEDFEETIFVEASGFAPASQRTRPAKGENVPRLTFTLTEGHSATGRVVDADGNPVEGATVITTLFQQFPPMPHEYGSRATTDAEGRFTLRNLPAETVFVHVSKKGHAPARQKSIVVDGETEIELSSSGVLKGQVVDEETGIPLDGFTMRSFSGDKYFSTADGVFVLEGSYSLGASYPVVIAAPGYGETHARIPAVPPDSNDPPALVKLGKARLLRGTVTDAQTGDPLSGADVVLMREDRTPGYLRMDVFEKINEYQGYLLTSSDEAGGFEFALGADEDRWLCLVARHKEYGPVILPDLRPDEAIEIRLQRTGKLLVRTAGVPGVEAGTGRVEVYDGPLLVASAAIGQDGTATVEDVSAGPARRVHLKSRNGLAQVAHVDVQPGETAEVDFANLPGPRLTGRVTCVGAPKSGVSVCAYPTKGQWFMGMGHTDEDGMYVIRGLPPGRYLIHAREKPPVYAPVASVSADLVMTDEDARLDFTLPGGRLTGRLLDAEGKPVPGIRVEAVPLLDPDTSAQRVIQGFRTEDRQCRVYSSYDIYESGTREGLLVTRSLGRQSGAPCDAESEPDGRFSINYLRPGEYRLRGARRDGRGDIATASVVIEMDGDSVDVELRMVPPETLRLQVVAAGTGEPVEGASALICATDGVFITSSLSDEASLIEHDGMPAGEYGVWVFAPGYAAQWVTPVKTSADPMAAPRIVELQPGASFRFKLADGALDKRSAAYLVYRITDRDGNPVFPGGEALDDGPLETGAAALTGPNTEGYLLNTLTPGYYTVEWEVRPVSGYDTPFSGKAESQAWTELKTVITLAR
jgi:beta-lactamase regulating signal transducer with metallopeptidase domain